MREAIRKFNSCQFTLAQQYENGDRVPKNNRIAVKIYAEIAGRGHLQSHACLADIFSKGRESVEKDMSKASYWLQLAVQNGAAEELFRIGCQYCPQSSREENIWIAIALIKSASNLGLIQAKKKLCRMYSKGVCGVKKNLDLAIQFAEEVADAGDPEDLFNLAVSFAQAWSVEKNFEQAAYCFLKAAKKNHREAQFNMGMLFKMGCNGGMINRDLEQAARWFEKSAAQGYDRAQSQLGVLHLRALLSLGVINSPDEDGVRYELEQVKSLFKEAVDQGLAEAKSNLAVLYALGIGVKKNNETARQLFVEATEQGYIPARDNLAIMSGQSNLSIDTRDDLAVTLRSV